jgi:hypothetical protein
MFRHHRFGLLETILLLFSGLLCGLHGSLVCGRTLFQTKILSVPLAPEGLDDHTRHGIRVSEAQFLHVFRQRRTCPQSPTVANAQPQAEMVLDHVLLRGHGVDLGQLFGRQHPLQRRMSLGQRGRGIRPHPLQRRIVLGQSGRDLRLFLRRIVLLRLLRRNDGR